MQQQGFPCAPGYTRVSYCRRNRAASAGGIRKRISKRDYELPGPLVARGDISNIRQYAQQRYQRKRQQPLNSNDNGEEGVPPMIRRGVRRVQDMAPSPLPAPRRDVIDLTDSPVARAPPLPRRQSPVLPPLPPRPLPLNNQQLMPLPHSVFLEKMRKFRKLARENLDSERYMSKKKPTMIANTTIRIVGINTETNEILRIDAKVKDATTENVIMSPATTTITINNKAVALRDSQDPVLRILSLPNFLKNATDVKMTMFFYGRVGVFLGATDEKKKDYYRVVSFELFKGRGKSAEDLLLRPMKKLLNGLIKDRVGINDEFVVRMRARTEPTTFRSIINLPF